MQTQQSKVGIEQLNITVFKISAAFGYKNESTFPARQTGGCSHWSVGWRWTSNRSGVCW
jgi:hypothetical protein